MKNVKRGRKSLKTQLEILTGQSNIWPWVNEKLGEAASTAEGIQRLREATDGKVSATVPTFRKLIVAGVRSGKIRKDTALCGVAKIGRGRPGKVEVAVETA